jgi:excisionase family DNA binding protein
MNNPGRSIDMAEINPTELYTVKDVAERLKCGKSTVYDLIKSEALAVTKIGAFGGGVRVMGSDIEAFLGSRKTGGPKPKMAFTRLGL